jgi:hypothetical protein
LLCLCLGVPLLTVQAMAPGEWGWMAAVAAEELAKLEAAHPGRLGGPLKDELKRLVADPGWDDADAFALAALDPTPSPSSQPAAPPQDLFTEGAYYHPILLH